jgi:very-short-patch-repair endonuclease
MMFVKLIGQELGLQVTKEFKFNPKRKWKFDYYIPELKLGIEVEGGTYKETWYRDKKTGELKHHVGGRHNTGEGFLEDCEKYNSATVLGFKILRFPPDKLFSEKTLNEIKEIYRKQLIR